MDTIRFELLSLFPVANLCRIKLTQQDGRFNYGLFSHPCHFTQQNEVGLGKEVQQVTLL